VSVDTTYNLRCSLFLGEGDENETADKPVQQCAVSLLHAEIARILDLLRDQNHPVFHVVRATWTVFVPHAGNKKCNAQNKE
jgi:hypothetical protein